MPRDPVSPNVSGGPKGKGNIPSAASAASQTPPVPDAQLQVADVQALLEVKSRGTVVNWIKSKRLPAKMLDGKYVIPWATLFVTPLVKRKAVLARRDVREAGITVAELSKAITDRIVSPAKGLYSLENVKCLIAHAKGEPILAPVESAPPVRQRDPAHPKSPRTATLVQGGPKHLRELEAYILEHGDPALLSDDFWAAHTQPPAFIPPAGVFLYRFTGDIFVRNGELYTAVSRSEGWQRGTDGSAVAVALRERYTAVEAGYCEDEDPEPFLTANFRYRERERAWALAWREHCARSGRPLKGDDGRRDRRAVLKRYITEGWSPSDLPLWFWALPEEPEFVAPCDEATYSWGPVYMKPHPDGNAYPYTKIQRSEVWEWEGEPMLSPPEAIDEEPGTYQDGDPLPPRWAACNHRYKWARSEWAQCYRLANPGSVPTKTATARRADAGDSNADADVDPPASDPFQH